MNALVKEPNAHGKKLLYVRVWTDAITGDPVDLHFPVGVTIDKIVQAIPLPVEKEGMRRLYEVYIGEHLIPRENWRLVKPAAWAQDGTAALVIRLPIRGKGGGAGKALSVVAAIALISLTWWAGGGGLSALGSFFNAGTWGARLAGAGMSVAGMLLLQGLAPKQKRESKDPISYASAQNNFEPGAPLQRVVGKCMISPQIVVPPFTTLYKGVTRPNRVTRYDQSVTLVLGMAGAHEINSVMIDGVDINSLYDLDVEYRYGTSSDTPLTLVTDTRIEERPSTQLTNWVIDPDDTDNQVDIIGTPEESEPRWHRVETKKDCEKFIMEYVLPSGLINRTSTGGTHSALVALRHRMRLKGASSWGSWINIPQLMIHAQEGNDAIRLQFEVRWVDKLPSTAGNTWPFVGASGTNRNYKKVKGWAQAWVTAGVWESPLLTYKAVSVGYAWHEWEWESDTRVILYLLKSKYPKGRWQFEVKRSWPAVIEDWTPGANHWQHGNIGTFDLFTPPIAATSTARARLVLNPSWFTDQVTLTMVQSVFSQYPIVDDGNPMTLIALRRKNASIGHVQVIATGKCPSWNGTTWTSAVATTNPGDWYRHVLKDSHNAQPVPSALRDDATFAAWAETCTAKGWHVGFIANGKSVDDVLATIALAGHASPDQGEKYSVVVDQPRTTKSGMITMRNARSFEFDKAFSDIPHGLRCPFLDASEDFAPREIIVYTPGYGPVATATVKEATLFETMTYEGIVYESEIRERAELDINWRLWRSTILTCEMDFEHLEFRRGNLMLWNMDIITTVVGQGRIVSYTVNGSNAITSITLDEEQTLVGSDADMWDVTNLYKVTDLWKVGRFGAAIRRDDGALVIVEVSSAENDAIIVLATPLAMPTSGGNNLIGAGTLVTCGALGSVAREVLIWDIRPAKNLEATITAVDYHGDIFYGG